MKKQITLLFIIIALITLRGGAQGLYIGVGGGYAIGANKTSDFDGKKTNYYSTYTTSETISKPNSLGGGYGTLVYVGYLFKNKTGIEIGSSFLHGSDISMTFEAHDHTVDYNQKSKHVLSGDMVRLIPALKMSTGNGIVHPYLIAGVIIGFSGKVTDKISSSSWGSGGPNYSTEAKVEYTKGLSYGFNGRLGTEITLENRISLFLELNYNFQSWAPGHGKIVSYTQDGTNVLSLIPQREVDYKKDYVYNSSSSPAYYGLRQGAKFFLPYSALGANIGVHIMIGKIKINWWPKSFSS